MGRCIVPSTIINLQTKNNTTNTQTQTKLPQNVRGDERFIVASLCDCQSSMVGVSQTPYRWLLTRNVFFETNPEACDPIRPPIHRRYR